MFLLLHCFQHLLKLYEQLKVPVNKKLGVSTSNTIDLGLYRWGKPG